MAAFDLYFAPTVSASVDAGDSDLWSDIFYGGTLENDWENVGWALPKTIVLPEDFKSNG